MPVRCLGDGNDLILRYITLPAIGYVGTYCAAEHHRLLAYQSHLQPNNPFVYIFALNSWSHSLLKNMPTNQPRNKKDKAAESLAFVASGASALDCETELAAMVRAKNTCHSKGRKREGSSNQLISWRTTFSNDSERMRSMSFPPATPNQ
ncbi:hypothetical protein IEQ34_020108 [Dendrobium chrysotoxum]|uniref:Uncharacterized protein n=1 Tax=Dendrobium chrysotoxum TaxID=161865 RepID=A0AAV7FZA0_DENCH|nr:hypothetical protein IEQ34_020108 [Dendrobium chrysotoxum]